MPDHDVTADSFHRLHGVRAVRSELHAAGPKRSRPFDGDFEPVALPAADCDILRDILVARPDWRSRPSSLKKRPRSGSHGSSVMGTQRMRRSSTAAIALRHFDLNLGWRPVSIAGRLAARRVPDEPFEPSFTESKPF